MQRVDELVRQAASCSANTLKGLANWVIIAIYKKGDRTETQTTGAFSSSYHLEKRMPRPLRKGPAK